MITLASLESFLGNTWFILLVGGACFVAGMVFKTAFLKIVSKD